MSKYLDLYHNPTSANIDRRSGLGITLDVSPTIGSQSVGRNVTKYLYDDVEDEDPDDDIDVSDDDLEAVGRLYQPVYNIDPHRTTVSHTGGNMRQSGALNEKPVHTTTARHGISPFKQRKFDGGAIGAGSADQAFKTTGNYKRLGTLDGTSHSYKFDDEGNDPLDIDDDTLGIDVKYPEERSYIKQFKIHQEKINEIFKLLENLEKIGYLYKTVDTYQGSLRS